MEREDEGERKRRICGVISHRMLPRDGPVGVGRTHTGKKATAPHKRREKASLAWCGVVMSSLPLSEKAISSKSSNSSRRRQCQGGNVRKPWENSCAKKFLSADLEDGNRTLLDRRHQGGNCFRSKLYLGRYRQSLLLKITCGRMAPCCTTTRLLV